MENHGNRQKPKEDSMSQLIHVNPRWISDIQSVMDYDFASISTVDKDLKEFLESPTQEKNLALLFQPVPANHTVYMCLIQRRYEGWLKSEYFDLYLQLGG